MSEKYLKRSYQVTARQYLVPSDESIEVLREWAGAAADVRRSQVEGEEAVIYVDRNMVGQPAYPYDYLVKYEDGIIVPMKPEVFEKAFIPKGDFSDGYHSFNELYQHRYVLFVGLIKEYYNQVLHNPNVRDASKVVWISKLHHDGTMFEDSFIVGAQLPTGQVSYHLPLREWDRVRRVLPVLTNAPEWDGHTPEDALKRLEEWIYGN